MKKDVKEQLQHKKSRAELEAGHALYTMTGNIYISGIGYTDDNKLIKAYYEGMVKAYTEALKIVNS